MTFSIVGRCARTGMLGVAITTSSICVGARCPWARAGVGAVTTQNVTDPRLGPEVLDLLAAGHGAGEAIARVTKGRADIAYRQLAAIDSRGGTAAFTGESVLGTHRVAEGAGCIAAGNLLATTEVVEAMVADFAEVPANHLAERLLNALAAGLAAGGEEGAVHSAALLVVDRQPWPLVDLRVDWDDANPVAALTRLWRDYAPQMDAYVARALAPSSAPRYGVPGDE